MSYVSYKSRVQPLCPVAVKVEQNEVHAPDHSTWGVVICDTCGERFYIGPNRIYRSRSSDVECAKQLEIELAEDHRRNNTHLNSYELPD